MASKGQPGAKQFNRNRKNILDEFDRLRELIESRPVKTAHGIGAEAYLRKWLSEFLPKKYGVTSGYVIPTLYDLELDVALYHYDVIIYNVLDAPVLWTEGNEDDTDQGKFRAIPAAHVVAVFEVKSRLTKANTDEAYKKLRELNAHREQLHRSYQCCVIFVELRDSDNNDKATMKALQKYSDIYGFSGGMVLRFEGDTSCTGIIRSYEGTEPTAPEDQLLVPLAKPMDGLAIFQNEEGNIDLAEGGAGAFFTVTGENTWSVTLRYGHNYGEGTHFVELDWSRSGFALFCIGLLSRLDGRVVNEQNHAYFGQIFDEVKPAVTPLQKTNAEVGKPFLSVEMYNGGPKGTNILINQSPESVSVQYWVKVTNLSDVPVRISDNRFKTFGILPARSSAVTECKVSTMPGDGGMKGSLMKDGFQMPFRLVYHSVEDEKKAFVAIEKTITVKDRRAHLA